MVWLGTLGLLLACASMAWAAPIYTTDFSANENPISESGAWSHISPLWANVQTAGGLAFGTQVGNLANPAAFNDSNATLSGFSPDVTITATVHLASNIADGQTHEVELLFRMGGGATQTRGYEMSFDTGGNVTLVRWNGDLGDYTFVNHTGGANNEVGGLKDGDVISAKASGNTFTASVNGVPIYTATDDTWKDGQPGIDELWLVYTRFVNSVSQTATPTQVSPVNAASDESAEAAKGDAKKQDENDEKDEGPVQYEFEPEPAGLVAALLPRYISSRIFSALLESAASESAARRRAMKSASDNATDLIRTYTRMANQARQAEITQEISEIVGGANALADASRGSE